MLPFMHFRNLFVFVSEMILHIKKKLDSLNSNIFDDMSTGQYKYSYFTYTYTEPYLYHEKRFVNWISNPGAFQ